MGTSNERINNATILMKEAIRSRFRPIDLSLERSDQTTITEENRPYSYIRCNITSPRSPVARQIIKTTL